MEITRIEVAHYEKVVRCRDQRSGLHALIAIHDTTLGPALGGMRMWPYAKEDDALEDVLRLSKGMTYKSAIAETGLGGGKSVIMGDPATDKSDALFHAMGDFINSLEGRYITAEDMNIGIPDLEVVRERTRWVTGLSRESGSSGNPSPYTATGCVIGMRAVLEETFGSDDFDGRKILIQGVGAVGGRLAVLLAEQGAEVINDETIPRLRCKAVAGCANNQLHEPRHAQALRERGILYAPDYVINAGGIINVSVELLSGGYQEAVALRRIDRIYDNLRNVFAISRREDIPTNEAAARLAEERIRAGRLARK